MRYQANRFGIKVYEIAIKEDHLHASIRFKKRQDYVRFIRAVTAHIVKTLSRLLKINLKGLFDVLPYTKIVSWGIQYRRTINYILINQLESLGFKNVRGGWFYDDWSKGQKSTSRQLEFRL